MDMVPDADADDLSTNPWRTHVLPLRTGRIEVVGESTGVHVDVERLHIGRSRNCELVLNDPTVSKVHAEVQATPRGVRIADLNSLNGTFVGKIALGEVYLNDLCDFQCGAKRLRFVPKAIDARTGKPKPLPKTQNAVRSGPIEHELLPLLHRMRKDAEDSGAADDAPILPVLGELNDRYRAKQLREHLHAAGMTRPRLFTETATLLQVDFRSCRDTGITWLALAGVGVDKMQRRAGHEDLSTTLGYVKMAEDLAGKVGTPFPPLPRDLVTRLEPGLGQGLGQVGARTSKTPMDPVPEEGIEGALARRIFEFAGYFSKRPSGRIGVGTRQPRDPW